MGEDRLLNITANRAFFIILICTPIIQIGSSYYFSVFFLVFFFLLTLSILLNRSKKSDFNLIYLAAFIFIFKSLLVSLETSDYRSAFLPLRELTCFIGLILISSLISKNNLKFIIIYKRINLLMCIILLLVFYQLFQISKGNYFGIPIDLFVKNKGTLEGADAAIYYGTRFRPTAFYGEPSYTSWIILSFLTIILKIKTLSFGKSLLTIVISFLTVSFSQSFSGVVSVILLATFWFLFESKKNLSVLSKLLIILFFVLFFSIMVNSVGDLNDRLMNILSNEDESANFRINYSATYLFDLFFNGHLLGVNDYGSLSFDNSIFGTLIEYGVLGIFLFGALFYFANDKFTIIYLILSFSFNGALFSYDKILIFSLVIGLSKSFKLKELVKRPSFSQV